MQRRRHPRTFGSSAVPAGCSQDHAQSPAESSRTRTKDAGEVRGDNVASCALVRRPAAATDMAGAAATARVRATMRAEASRKRRGACGGTMFPHAEKVQRAGGGFIHRSRWLSDSGLRLPRTTLGCGFDLLPLRARCTREPTRSVSVRQDPCRGRSAQRCGNFRCDCYSETTDGNRPSREIELLGPPSGCFERFISNPKPRSRTNLCKTFLSARSA